MINKSECISKTLAYQLHHPLFWIFKGIPFNIILNTAIFLICLLIFLLWRQLTKFLRKQGMHLPSIEDEVANETVQLRWRDIFWTSDELYVERAGFDALIYMHATELTMVQSATLIVPFLLGLIEFSKSSAADEFERLLLSNLDASRTNHWLLFAGNICTAIFFLGIAALRYRFAVHWESMRPKLPTTPQYPGSDRVLMLTGVKDESSSEVKKKLEAYFLSLEPPLGLVWVQPVLRLNKLAKLQRRRDIVENYLFLAQFEQTRTGREVRYLDLSGPSNALHRYEEKLLSVSQKITDELTRLQLRTAGPVQVNAPMTGVVFAAVVNVSTDQYSGLEPRNLLDRLISISRDSVPFGQLQLAPHPSELYWSTLMDGHYKTLRWWLKRILVHTGVFMLALVLTSPTYIFYILHYLGVIRWLENQQTFLSFQWLPSVVLALSVIVMRNLIVLSEDWTQHATRNGHDLVAMRILFAFLLITVLIFPALGMAGLPYAAASIAQLFRLEQLTWRDLMGVLRAECVFLPDTAALFVNYLITSALLGVGLQLLQLGRWVRFVWRRLCYVRSKVEAKLLAQHFPNAFDFREHYALVALTLTITTAIAPVCPLIVPFGLFGLFSKLLVDKYALLRIHAPPGAAPMPLHFVTQPPPTGDKHLGHMSWFVQSTHFSLVGLCLFFLNLTVFYASHADQLKALCVTYGAVTVGLVLAACVLSWWGASRWRLYAERFGKLLRAGLEHKSTTIDDYTAPALMDFFAQDSTEPYS